jgi:hypothetical protein
VDTDLADFDEFEVRVYDTRRGHLLDLIGQWDQSVGANPPAIYAVACRWTRAATRGWLESWNREVKPGLPLPRLHGDDLTPSTVAGTGPVFKGQFRPC